MRVKGNNRDSLRLAADKVKSVMSEFDGLSLVHDNWEGATSRSIVAIER